jgi:P-type conjugative transfer protein TrbG
MRIDVVFLAVISMSVSACAATPLLAAEPNSVFKPAFQHRDAVPPAVAPQIAAGTVIGPKRPVATKAPHPLASPVTRVEAANRKALEEPTASGYIDAVQVYPFSENALYRLYAAPLQVTDITLQTGETLSAVSAGDTVRWAVGDTTSGSGPSRQVHVLVKPFEAGLKTNLIILTDRRTYHLDLKSTKCAAMAAISWSYPNDSLIAAKNNDATNVPATIDSGIALGDLHFGYKITGDDPPWRPLRAFDDGQKVYIEFPKTIAEDDAPPLFVIGADGASDLVNYRVRGHYYVVDRLFKAAELRLGQDSKKIVRITRTDGAPAHGGLALLFGG